MLKALTVALLLLTGWVCPASAQTFGSSLLIGVTGQVYKAGVNSGFDTRDVLLCFVPDVQHLASGKLWVPDQAGKTCSTANPVNATAPSQNSSCTGGFCTQSVYCKTDWRHTDYQLLMNMAYEMTGQWSKMDYSGISGFDSTASFAISPGDHPKCDAIISLGDMTDQPTFALGDPNYVENGNPVVYPDEETGCGGGKCYDSLAHAQQWYAGLSDQTKYEWSSTEAFWNIIDASGIPYLPVKGNHDSKAAYRRLMNRLNFTSKSFYIARETNDEQAWAIKFPTGSGKSFCVVALPDAQIDNIATDGSTAAERSFLTTTTQSANCTGLPTIWVSHEIIDQPTFFTGPLKATFGLAAADAANSNNFMTIAGHYGTPANTMSSIAGGSPTCGATGTSACAYAHFRAYANWQDIPRHPTNVNAPYGSTSQDAIGGMYVMFRIMPQRNLVRYWGWSPYYRTTNMPAEVTAGCGACDIGNFSFAFNFDARYP